MDLPTLAGLLLLALLDSTSAGTLLLPLWMLLSPGPAPVRRVVLHLGVVAGCYALLGVGLLGVGTQVLGSLGGRTGPVLEWAQLVLGVALVAASFVLDPGGRRRPAHPGRTERWRRRVATMSDRGAVALAGGAVAVEVATMLPYLAALGIVGGAGLPVVVDGGIVVAYCLLMVTPALVLLSARVVAAERVEPLLRRVEGWLARQGDSALAWLLGIAGFLLARDAVTRLGGLETVLSLLRSW